MDSPLRRTAKSLDRFVPRPTHRAPRRPRGIAWWRRICEASWRRSTPGSSASTKRVGALAGREREIRYFVDPYHLLRVHHIANTGGYRLEPLRIRLQGTTEKFDLTYTTTFTILYSTRRRVFRATSIFQVYSSIFFPFPDGWTC